MAKIILAPNESFEHFHSEESSTILLEGNADYQMGNFKQALQPNIPILTPANRSHTIINTGSKECMFGCSHG